MKKLLVRYKWGKIPFSYGGTSAAQVRQVLTAITPELAQKLGKYTWSLAGESGAYKIIAQDERGQRWTEATGKSPAKVLHDFAPARDLLTDVYGITAPAYLK